MRKADADLMTVGNEYEMDIKYGHTMYKGGTTFRTRLAEVSDDTVTVVLQQTVEIPLDDIREVRKREPRADDALQEITPSRDVYADLRDMDRTHSG